MNSNIYTWLFFISGLILSPLSDAIAQGFFQYKIDISHPNEEINSPVNDYAPVLSGDGSTLYFTSYRKEGSVGNADVFSVGRSGSAWGRAINSGPPLNSKEDDGSVAFMGKGEFVIFTSDKREGNVGNADLYMGIVEGGKVIGTRNLGPEVNSTRWDSQPTVSGDGEILYFVSDRPGGFGGTDIWMSRVTGHRQDGTPIWGKAENVGPTINSEKDERSPFITEDGAILYFASDGPGGFGGFDIYASIMELGEWEKPSNLGAPINSPADEMFFSASTSAKSFFFSSTRQGGFGKLDIYSGSPNVFGNGLCHITFNVVDSADHPLPGVVTVADAETGDTVATLITSLGQLDYIQHLPAERRYRVTATVPGRSPRVVELERAKSNETRRLRLSFDPFTVAEFDLAKYNIPFFVSGYYRPNVSANLDALFDLREKRLKKATYIEQFSFGSRKHREYRAYARIIDTVFGSIYTEAVNKIFPRFEREAVSDEILEIRVTGFADPQPFVGTYYDDETAVFLDTTGVEHTVNKGASITNLELSGLRAWYSAQLLDRLFALSKDEGKLSYERLKAAGKIRLRVIGASVPANQANYQTQRRISIELVRTNGSSLFDLDAAHFK